ncbi:hypothetical protein [Amycolatopsis tolypomycina]|uniref:Uncharacterized protein n=1 Tax=Amycolatopsis tolypomycina TaxID=208445 RepID=A0A1H4U088_9PSEU|nr:hypothetical protein [Amycolatopsis tolypomycina]SEC62155.1 hypothetical protein SAMN04489727_4432 [Amycolatopsis tolypomycina]
MASLKAGMVMKHNHQKVVILQTGLSSEGAEAVKIARLSTRRPAGSARSVEAKTWAGVYWIPLDQVSVVKAAGVVYAATGPGRVSKETLKEVLKEVGGTSG